MITRLRSGRELELRAFALTDMVRYGYSGLRGYSGISEGSVRGIPAIHRAARLRAEAIASLRLRCWRGEGVQKKRDDNVWQAKLFNDPPNEYQTRFGFWETVGESLAYRNNAYIWKNVDPLSLQVIELWALHPDQVSCKGAGRYEVDVRTGYVDPVGRGEGRYKVDDSTILHIRGHGDGGSYDAPSPIQVFKEALSGPVERQRHESRMWRKGTALQLAVVFPQTVNQQDAASWRETWQATYDGTDGETTAVIGGGAEIRPIGMTMKDAEYVQMARLTIDDAALIMGVPANLLGAKTADGVVPNLEQDLTSWLRFGLGPELERIESHLAADRQLFSPLGRSVYPGFDTEQFVRGDVRTEDDIAHARVQDGRLLVDEWRASVGLPPLPGGAGKIPQVVPVGGGPNPNNGSSNGKVPNEAAA